MAGGFVLVDDTFVSHAVNNWNRFGIGSFGLLDIFGVNGGHNFLDVSTYHGTQAGIVVATLGVLARALAALSSIGHDWLLYPAVNFEARHYAGFAVGVNKGG